MKTNTRSFLFIFYLFPFLFISCGSTRNLNNPRYLEAEYHRHINELKQHLMFVLKTEEFKITNFSQYSHLIQAETLPDTLKNGKVIIHHWDFLADFTYDPGNKSTVTNTPKLEATAYTAFFTLDSDGDLTDEKHFYEGDETPKQELWYWNVRYALEGVCLSKPILKMVWKGTK